MKLFDLNQNPTVVIIDMEKSHIGFDKLQHKVEGQGHSAESAAKIAAAVGRKKYGEKKMEHAAEEGKPLKDSQKKDEDDDDVKKSIHSWSQQEGTGIRVVDENHGPLLKRPMPTNNLFPMVEGDITVYSRNPIQQQRANDGTPHTTGGPTGLRPPEPELYLSKAFKNPDVPEEANSLNHQYDPKKYEPQKIVKAFLEG